MRQTRAQIPQPLKGKTMSTSMLPADATHKNPPLETESQLSDPEIELIQPQKN